MRLAVQNRPGPSDAASQRSGSVAVQEESRPPTRPPTRGGGGDDGLYESERMEKRMGSR